MFLFLWAAFVYDGQSSHGGGLPNEDIMVAMTLLSTNQVFYQDDASNTYGSQSAFLMAKVPMEEEVEHQQ